jgi:hypothetical protein
VEGESDPNPAEGTRSVLDAKFLHTACYARTERDTMLNPVRGLLFDTGVLIPAWL